MSAECCVLRLNDLKQSLSFIIFREERFLSESERVLKENAYKIILEMLKLWRQLLNREGALLLDEVCLIKTLMNPQKVVFMSLLLFAFSTLYQYITFDFTGSSQHLFFGEDQLSIIRT